MVWLLALALAGTCTGLTDDLDPASWAVAPMFGGTSSVDPTSSSSELVLVYWRPTNGFGGYGTPAGTPWSTATYETTVSEAGTLSFDWTHDYNHGWWNVQVLAEVVVDGSATVLHELYGTGSNGTGSQTVTGTETVPVLPGDTVAIRLSGSNYDSGSGITGTFTLSNVVFDAAACDCSGVFHGAAAEDLCGTCDADPGNDCQPDCAGVYGGIAYEDDCGVCNDDPLDDCQRDCAGVYGGTAYQDGCGDCVGGTTGLAPCDTGDTGTGPAPDDTADTGLPTDPGPGTAPTDTTGPAGTTPTGTSVPLDEEPDPQAVDGCGCQQTGPRSPWAWLARR
jgi:hypothetical protein